MKTIFLATITALILATTTLLGHEREELFLKVGSLTPAQHDLYRQIADELRCPTCTGLSIIQSDAPFSILLKNVLVDEIKKGKTYDEVIAHFTTRYGLWILREPPKSGFHLIAWLAPMMLGLFAITMMVWVLFIKKRKNTKVSP